MIDALIKEVKEVRIPEILRLIARKYGRESKEYETACRNCDAWLLALYELKYNK